MIESAAEATRTLGSLEMRDPRAILSEARQGAAPSDWAVFTTRRGRVIGFLSRTSNDPDPLLVITPEGVVEFVDHREDLHVMDFDQLSEITLQVKGRPIGQFTATADVWLDLLFRDGRKQELAILDLSW